MHHRFDWIENRMNKYSFAIALIACALVVVVVLGIFVLPLLASSFNLPAPSSVFSFSDGSGPLMGIMKAYDENQQYKLEFVRLVVGSGLGVAAVLFFSGLFAVLAVWLRNKSDSGPGGSNSKGNSDSSASGAPSGLSPDGEGGSGPAVGPDTSSSGNSS